jgi:tetratricopeptide (TPR) repeat protein
VAAFVAGYLLTPDDQSFSMPFASNDQISINNSSQSLPNALFANRFEFALILGVSAAATAAIVFAALGGNAVQRQNDRLSGLSHEMDHIRDRIASIELEEAIRKREMRTSSSQFSSDQFYSGISRDIQESFKNKERYDEVLRRLELILELSPNDNQLWHYKGIVLGKKGMFDEAIKAFEHISSLDRVSLYNRAVALAATGQDQRAQDLLEFLLTLNPRDSNTQDLLKKIRDRRQINYEMEFRFP